MTVIALLSNFNWYLIKGELRWWFTKFKSAIVRQSISRVTRRFSAIRRYHSFKFILSSFLQYEIRTDLWKSIRIRKEKKKRSSKLYLYFIILALKIISLSYGTQKEVLKTFRNLNKLKENWLITYKCCSLSEISFTLAIKFIL